MKVGILVMVLLVFSLQFNMAIQQEGGMDQMSSFMGAIWKVNALDFKNAFVYTIDLKWDSTFYLANFKLADITFDRISFVFLDKDGLPPKRLTKTIAHSYYLEKILVTFKNYHFDFILDTFKYKYGKPYKIERDSNQSLFRVIWRNSSRTRMIILNRYSEKEGISLVELVPYSDQLLKNRAQRIQALAEKF
jgi:cytoplasmic iron level regulating protein YaaA (DUF328/UPF0246 family)